ncbi:MAG TPA: hypothetical protein VLE91_01300 [Candidatus Saccharimonadales bacterium]|nr:hypothetical protein [Candidatus Saccharimonadales bacterium]
MTPPDIHLNISPNEVAALKDFVAGHGGSIISEKLLPSEIQVPESSLSWTEEMDRVQLLITKSKDRYEDGQKAEIVGLLGHHDLRYHPEIHSYAGDTDKFAQDVWSVLQYSVDEYRKHDDRPAFSKLSGKYGGSVYRNLGYGILTPREIRLTIQYFGLSGERKSNLELQASEGLAAVRDLLTYPTNHLYSGIMALNIRRASQSVA